MIEKQTSPRPSRRSRGSAVVIIVVVALAVLGCGADRPTESTGKTSRHASERILRAPERLPLAPESGDRGARDVGPFDLDQPTVANLDPELREALQAAARDAEDDGVRIVVTSGWRSRAHQQRLFDEAVSEYGSEAEARRWVSTPDTSAHVTGDAVDLGPTEADDWLSRHGADYGLCQVFANEVWHYELATTPGGVCPDLLPDSSVR